MIKNLYFIIILLLITILVASCSKDEAEYVYQLTNINPLTENDEYIDSVSIYDNKYVLSHKIFKMSNKSLGFITTNKSGSVNVKLYNSDKNSVSNSEIKFNNIFIEYTRQLELINKVQATNNAFDKTSKIYFASAVPDGSNVFLMSYFGLDTVILKVNADGNKVFLKPLSELSKHLYNHISMEVSSSGTIFLSNISSSHISDDNFIIAISETGEELYTLDIPNDFIYDRANRLQKNDSGEVFFCYKSNNGYKCLKINEQTRCLESTEISTLTGLNVPIMGNGYDIFYYNIAGLYGINTDSDAVCVLNWSDVGLTSDMVYSITICSIDEIYIEYIEPADGKVHFGKLTKLPADKLDKTMLTIAYDGDFNHYNELSSFINCAAMFNRNNNEYQIKLNEYNSSDGFNITQKLANNITAGKSPDMILFNGNLSYQLLEKHNILRDLYEFMDNDSEYNRSAFLPCTLKPFENSNGKLKSLAVDFKINTLTGSNLSLVDKNYLSIDDMLELSNSYEYLISFNCGSDEPKNSLFNNLLYGMLGNYIDYETKSCDFSANFSKLLQLCNTAKIYNANSPVPDLFNTNKVALRLKTYSSIFTFLTERHIYSKNGDINYFGYPCEKEVNSTIISPSIQFAITSQSKYPEIAWTFLTTYFTLQNNKYSNIESAGDYMSVAYTFPCTYESVDSLLNATRKFKYTSIGSYRVDSYGNEIFEINSTIKNYTGELSADEYIFTDEDEAALRYLLENITTAYIKDDASRAIISEEASYYFSGAKSLEETVKIIQNRVNTRINE